jgi:uncharacterized repeat protein (TIGR03806 family)
VIALLIAVAASVQSERPAWTSGRLQGREVAVPPYRAERAFPNLEFRDPIELLSVPGTGVLAVAEWRGRILFFQDRPDVDRTTLGIQLDAQLLGMAFHPRFAENRFLYVAQVPADKGFVEITRFTVLREPGWRIVPESSVAILRWPSKGALVHHGGALRFGPDGCLYLGVGDGSEGMDAGATGQDLSDLASSILRIDVDRAPRYLRYGIPRDNPFADRAGARPEIWAYGFRQPWRMSFDRTTGELWVGDIGQDLYESVFRVRRGGNYGWSVMEGPEPVRPDRPRGPTPVLPPTLAHPHTEFRSVIGGLVYRGARLPELAGSYIYGDYMTGRIWEARFANEQLVRQREIAATRMNLVSFGEDARGELHVLSFTDGRIYRLAPNEARREAQAFPRRLSETGLFESVADHRPASGVVPYQVAAPLWSDGAAKERFLAMPGTSKIRFEAIPNIHVKSMAPSWEFPDGTALVKTFSLGGRRIETRLLLLRKLAKARDIRDQAWEGYSYRWNAEQTDADLVDAAGRDEMVDVEEGNGARRQSWRYPSRAECFLCHTMAAHVVLGVHTAQMNRDIDVHGQGWVNQLDQFRHLGLFENPPPTADRLPRLADYEDRSLDVERRARSYLQANCAHCHVPGAGGNALFQLISSAPLAHSGVIDAPPVRGDLGLSDARLVAPGAPERSMIRHRMGLQGAGRMPPIASSMVDRQGMELLAEWIRQVPSSPRPTASTHGWISGAGAVLLALAGIAGWRWARRLSGSGSRSG